MTSFDWRFEDASIGAWLTGTIVIFIESLWEHEEYDEHVV